MHPADLARAVEDEGLASVWVPEKTHVPKSRETPWPGGALPERYKRTYDPFVALSMMASVTGKVALGTGVCLPAVRDPIVLAKVVASLDHGSGGRFRFGVGYGWNREELANHGVAYGDARSVMRDKLALMQALWSNPGEGYEGAHCSVSPSWLYPRPVSVPWPPILIGGRAGPRVFTDVAALADGWMPIEGYGFGLDDIARLREACQRAGRDPSTVLVLVYSATPDRRRAADYLEAGVSEVVYALPSGTWRAIKPVLREIVAIRDSLM